MPTKSGYRVKVYEADMILRYCGYAKDLPTDAAVHEAYARMTKRARVRDLLDGPIPDLHIVPQGGGVARYRENRISIGRGWGSNEAVLVHELAHFVAHRNGAYTIPDPRYKGAIVNMRISDPGHGAGFATAQLDLTRNILGDEAARALKFAYAQLGIKVLDAAGGVRRSSSPRPMERWNAWTHR